MDSLMSLVWEGLVVSPEMPGVLFQSRRRPRSLQPSAAALGWKSHGDSALPGRRCGL